MHQVLKGAIKTWVAKRGLNTKLHLAVDAHGLPIRILIIPGTTHDVKQSEQLIEGIAAKHLIADKAYDDNELISKAIANNTAVVIPPTIKRKEKRTYDKQLYKLRHLVANAFPHLKRWRAIATRYAKKTCSFFAAIQIRCMILWL